MLNDELGWEIAAALFAISPALWILIAIAVS